MKLVHFALGRLRGLVAAFAVLEASALFAQVTVSHNAGGGLTEIRASTAMAPVIIGGPVNFLAVPGQSVAFSVLSTGTLPLSYQWFFNSNRVAGATGDSLLLANIAATNFGAYYVVAANQSGAATSAVARLELDADKDGLADSWELTYFGSLTNQAGAFDKDHDGNNNLTEYLEGTNPTNALSLLPRLTVIPYRCQVSIDPLLDKYTNGQPVTLTATPDDGQTFIGWFGATNSLSNVVTLVMTTNQTVMAQAGLPLAESLGVTNRVLTGGDIAWFGQPLDTHDGVDAARSGRMTNSQTSWFQMTNTMSADGTVTFWWKVSSQENYDYLKLSVNGTLKPGQISGVTDWQSKTYYLAAGASVVRWEFTKSLNDGASSDGITLGSDAAGTVFYAYGPYPGVAPEDAAWVDQVVFEPYADPLRDTDGNGLPDLWQYRYFYALGQSPTADPDHDGISNLDEYLDGTDPTSNSSVKPRLNLSSVGAGSVTANPGKPKYDYGETVTNSAVPDPGNYFVMWTGASFSTNTNTTVSMTANRVLKGVFGFSLDQALDTTGLTWTRGGSVGWYGETNVTHDGVGAAQSAPITSGGESWMETSVVGPGGLSFWWKVSCLTNSNTLRLNLNGVEQAYRISGEVDWQPQFLYFGPGTNTFRWRFFRNNYSTNFIDAGWVDQVRFTPGDLAPNLLLQPTNLTVLQGSNVTLNAFAAGTPTILYEWLRNGISLGAASTNTSLTISNITPAQGGGYSVQVANAGGVATNTVPFTITVLPVPPVNDNFSGRLTVSAPGDTASGYNFGATREANEPAHAGLDGSRSVWWSWVAPQSGLFRLQASSQGIASPLLAVYTGGAVNALTPVAAAQSYGTYSNDIDYAEVEVLFHAASGTAYAFAVDTAYGDAGWIQLALTNVPPPPNDFFANRILLSGSSVAASGYNIGATAEVGEPDHSGFGGSSNSVWWAWSPPHDGVARLNAQGTTYSPVIAVYQGATVTTLSPVAATVTATQIDFPVSGGATYAIAFDGLFGAVGNVQFTLGLLNPAVTASFSKGSLQLAFDGLPGTVCVVQTSSNLTTWTSVLTNTIPAGGIQTFSTSLPILEPQRYYRIQVQ